MESLREERSSARCSIFLFYDVRVLGFCVLGGRQRRVAEMEAVLVRIEIAKSTSSTAGETDSSNQYSDLPSRVFCRGCTGQRIVVSLLSRRRGFSYSEHSAPPSIEVAYDNSMSKSIECRTCLNKMRLVRGTPAPVCWSAVVRRQALETGAISSCLPSGSGCVRRCTYAAAAFCVSPRCGIG